MNLSKTLTIFLVVCLPGGSQVALGQSSTRPAPYPNANVPPSLPTQLPSSPATRGTLSDQGRTFPNPTGSQANPMTGPSGTGFAGSPQTYSASTDQKLADLSPERTFGWEYDESSNELVYIMQVSPDHADQMLMESKLNNGKKTYASSTMPIELVGRIRTITVQIGTDILPRRPTLEELRRTPRLDESQTMAELDNLGRGSIARLEPDGSALPVQRTLPAAPNYSRPTTGNTSPSGLPSGGLDATGSQRGGQGGAGSQFLSEAGAPATSLPDYAATNSNPMRGGYGAGTRSGLDERNPAAERELTAQLPDYSNNGSGLPQYDSTGRPNTQFSGQSGQGYADPPSMASLQPRGNPTFGQAPTAPSFANRGSQYEQSLASAGTSLLSDRATRQSNDDYLNRNKYDPQNRGLPNQPNSRQEMQPTGPTQQPAGYDRMADARYDATRLPTALPGSTFPSTTQPPKSDSAVASPSELAERQRLADAEEKKQEQADAEAAARQNQTNLITLFCVLSLVVNCYLFMLIRKLLTRYRTLLTNVRSQTA